MRITFGTKLAIRLVLHLARRESEAPIPIRVMSEEERVSAEFAREVLSALARKGILRSERGPEGGFRLGRHPAQISLLDIFDAMEESFEIEGPGNEETAPPSARVTEAALRAVEAVFRQQADSMSIAGLLHAGKPW